jgi:hypothetical protein
MADKKCNKYSLSYDGAEPKVNDYTSLNSLPPFPEIASPQTYFLGAPALPGATATIGWQVVTAPAASVKGFRRKMSDIFGMREI